MKTAEAKTSATSHALQQKGQQPFFQKKEHGQRPFFAKAPPVAQPFFSPLVQAKLTIGHPGDKYEQEADAMADKVVQRLAVGSQQTIGGQDTVQAKCAECAAEDEKLQKMDEGEEEIQEKADGIQRKSIFESNEEQPPTISTFQDSSVQMKSDAPAEASIDLQNRLNASKGGGQSLSDETRSSMESAFGSDFSHVRVHTGSQAVQMNQELGAQAFTHGSDVYFNKGKYSPGTTEGQRLLGHELTHVVQQGGGEVKPKKTGNNYSIKEANISGCQNNEIVQRYFEATGTVSGSPYRVSDDMTASVKVGYPNHNLYAKAGKAAIANVNLAAVGSGIELKEESESFNVSRGSSKETLKKVIPVNKQNTTSGDKMELWDDCGDSAGVVVGGTNRTAIHRNAMTGSSAKTSASSPSLMKAEIMKKLMNKWLTMPSTSAESKKKINETIALSDAKQLEIDKAEADFAAAATDAEREAIIDVYWAQVDEYGNIMMLFYNSMPESKREEIDKYLGINRFANPNVGQGYTMSSGGKNYPGARTWNFHWGGVVMKSDDNKDNVTLENYAMGGATKVENQKWDFAMYGTAKKGQTFHEQHQDTKQHGDRPTTMTIEEK